MRHSEKHISGFNDLEQKLYCQCVDYEALCFSVLRWLSPAVLSNIHNSLYILTEKVHICRPLAKKKHLFV